MKHSKHHDNPHGYTPPMGPVRFQFTHPTAASVCVAGSFNGWQPEAKPLHPMGGGRWIKDTVLPPGTYEYCLVVDGVWMPDPAVPETVSNPFGGRNSILHVRLAAEPSAAGAAAA